MRNNPMPICRSLLVMLIATLALISQPLAEGSVEGRVVSSSNGQPLRNCRVHLLNSNGRVVAQTDREGKFVFPKVSPGSYRLSASRTGYMDRTLPQLVTVVPSDQVSNVEIRLPPYGAITGRILDEVGDPVDHARVWAFRQICSRGRMGWERQSLNFETNDRGEYRIANLKPGRYLVQAYDPNGLRSDATSVYIPTFHPSTHEQEMAAAVELGLSAEIGGIDIGLLKVERPLSSAKVKGTVIGVRTDSQVVVSVTALPVDGRFSYLSAGTTAKAPDYDFELSLPPGSYVIHGNVYSGAPEAYGRVSVNVAADTPGVVLHMSQAPEVTGQIRVAERGAPLALDDARVTLTRYSGADTENVSLTCDAAGKCAPQILRPGQYAVSLRSIPDGSYVQRITFGGQDVSRGFFEVSDSGLLEIILSRMGGKVSGTVLGSGGTSVGFANVILASAQEGSCPIKQLVGLDGGFQFTNLSPGRYTVFPSQEMDDEPWQEPDYLKRRGISVAELTVAPGETINVQLHGVSAKDF